MFISFNFYSGPSHSLELEQGPLGVGVGPIITRPQNVRTGPESQLLPSHLKCGMWASLALATLFVAGNYLLQETKYTVRKLYLKMHFSVSRHRAGVFNFLWILHNTFAIGVRNFNVQPAERIDDCTTCSIAGCNRGSNRKSTRYRKCKY